MTVMRRWFLVAGTVLSCVALVSSRDAQESRRRGKWWQAEDVRRDLGLTVEQSQSLEQIFQATAPELRAARDRLDELQNELSRLLADETTSESIVAREVDRVESARSELSKLRTLMLFRMHRVLTPEQRIKLNALHDRDRRGGERNQRFQ